MAEFSLTSFADSIIELFLNSSILPVSSEFYVNKNGISQLYKNKHKDRQPLHLKEAISECIGQTRFTEQDLISFDIGSDKMESMHPYYHILEDTPYIRKKEQGTEKTLGSQAKVEVGKRDYGIVSWNGKTFTKEYARNVRGKRNRLNKTSHWVTNSKGEQEFINRDSNTYLNVHYQYIERILDSIVDPLADLFGLKKARKIDSGLAEEYFSQFDEAPNNILDIIGSF